MKFLAFICVDAAVTRLLFKIRKLGKYIIRRENCLSVVRSFCVTDLNFYRVTHYGKNHVVFLVIF